MKFKPHPKHGTNEDLRKMLLLNYPGCKTIHEALEKQKQEREQSKPSPTQDLPLNPTISEVFKIAVSEIEHHLANYDIDLMSPEKRFELAKMPVSTIDEINYWKRGWLNVGTKE